MCVSQLIIVKLILNMHLTNLLDYHIMCYSVCDALRVLSPYCLAGFFSAYINYIIIDGYFRDFRELVYLARGSFVIVLKSW